MRQARLPDRLVGREHGQPFRQERRAHGLDIQRVDGARDGGAQALGGKARDPLDAGFARRHRAPGLVLAEPDGGDDAHAGDGDERTALIVAKAAHLPCRIPSRSPGEAHRALAAPMADGGHERLVGLSAGDQRRRDGDAGRCLPSIVWPITSPVAWMAAFGAISVRAACSSSVMPLTPVAPEMITSGFASSVVGLPFNARAMLPVLPPVAIRRDARDRRQGLGAPRRRVLAGFENQEGGAAARGSCRRPRRAGPRPGDKPASRGSRPFRRSAAHRAAPHYRRRPTRKMSFWPEAMRACAMRIASTPLNSSPMKVRDAPVTP